MARAHLCPRLKAIAAGTEDPPSQSNISATAFRELDAYELATPSIATLTKLDQLVET